MAADDHGRWLPVGSDEATRFNLRGAVIRVAGHRARDAVKALEDALRGCSSATFAATLTSPTPLTHAESLWWLDQAIERLRAQNGRGSEVSGLRPRVTDETEMERTKARAGRFEK
jgi:hypothetical protein